jgi:hypothetical protein
MICSQDMNAEGTWVSPTTQKCFFAIDEDERVDPVLITGWIIGPQPPNTPELRPGMRNEIGLVHAGNCGVANSR